MIPALPNMNWREFQNFYIRPRSGTDSAQWDWGIRQPINENGRKMTKYQEAYIWNKLPAAENKSPSFLTFKKKIKKHYLQLQNC